MSKIFTMKTTHQGVRYVEDEQGNIVQKECTKCGEMHKIENFPKQPKGLGGVESMCKSCKYRATQFNRLVSKLNKEIESI